MTRAPLASARSALTAFAERKVPPSVRDVVRIEAEWRGNAATLFERRPPWRAGIGPDWSQRPVARLRFDADAGRWLLSWKRATGRWERYGDYASISRLIAELESDPHNVFWG